MGRSIQKQKQVLESCRLLRMNRKRKLYDGEEGCGKINRGLKDGRGYRNRKGKLLTITNTGGFF